MAWWSKAKGAEQNGIVLLPGRFPYQPGHFEHVERSGIRVQLTPADGASRWTAALEHPQWGRALLVALRDPYVPPRPIVDHSLKLTADERASVLRSESSLLLTCEARSGNVLADRKELLRFLFAVLGDVGVAAFDPVAQDFWSREALEDELAHDAELDIEAIHSLHAVSGESGGAAYWLHSHGLGEIGFFEYDVLDPLPDLSRDLLRAIAYSVVEGRIAPGGPPAAIVPGEEIRAVPVRDFLALTPPDAHADWRRSLDPDHEEGHAVLCDPRRTGWLARALKREAPSAARILREPLGDDRPVYFSRSASDLSARRARQTLPVLRAALEDLAELGPRAVLKLAYRVDGGADGENEHLWFEVHAIDGDGVDATLLNQPLGIAGRKRGDRGRHSLDRLTDWMMSTPIGPVDPRQTRRLRVLRANRAEILERLRDMPPSGPG